MNAAKNRWKAVLTSTFLALGALAFVAVGVSAATTTHVTCAVTVSSENLANNAVQSAINSFPGQTICLGAGSFPEQLTISVSGTSLVGAGATKTFIDPATVALNTVDYDSASSVGNAASLTSAAAIILVSNSTSNAPTSGVVIQGLAVNGTSASSSFGGCGPNYFGIDFQNASGSITSDAVIGVALPPPQFGCQDGLAVYVYNGHYYSGLSPTTTVAISGTKVVGYDKNGITCDDPGVACMLSGNTVTGAGPVTNNAQNGIQIGFGASAKVTANHVSGNGYTGTTATNDWYANGYSAAGILLYDSANGTSVTGNTVVLNQLGIAYFDDGVLDGGFANTTIALNTVKESNAYGIVAQGAPGGGDRVAITSNTVSNKKSLNPVIYGAPGILVDTGSFVLTTNHVLGAATTGTNGPNQEVCGPNSNSGIGTPFLTCANYENISTAAIQVLSESSTNPTSVTLSGNTYGLDVAHLASMTVLGGSVSLLEVS